MVGPSEPTNFVLTYEKYMEGILYKVILSEVINAAQISFLLPSLHHQKSLACLDLHALDSFERELNNINNKGHTTRRLG